MTIRYFGWFGGALAGSGTTSVQDGEFRTGSAAKQLVDRTLRIAAPADVSGALQVVGNAHVELESTLTLQDNTAISGTGALHVAPGATLTKPGAGVATLTLGVDNDGTLDVGGGTLRLSAGTGVSAGAYAVAANAVLEWAAGNFALSAPRSTGAGTLRVNGANVTTSGTAALASVELLAGTLTAGGPLSAGAATLTAGTIGGTGALAFDRLAWSGGTLAGTGTVTAGALSVTGAAGKRLSDRTLVLTGDSTLDGTGALTLDGTARLENAARMQLLSGLTISSTTGLLVNRPGATLIRAGIPETTTLAVPLDNDGRVEAATGTLRLTAGSGLGEVSTGTYATAAGARIEWAAGAYALDGPSATGAGEAVVDGAALTSTGAASFATLAVRSGGAHFAGTLAANAVDLSGGTLSGAGAMTLGRLAWTAGTFAGAGTTTTGAVALDGAATKLLRDRTLVLTGTSTLDTPLELSGAAVLRNQGLLDLRADVTIRGTRLENAGTLRKSAGAGPTTLALVLDNTGVVDVRTGTLQAVGGLANYDAATKTLSGGEYDLTGTLAVPGLEVARNAATIRLRGAGRLDGGALDGLAENTGALELDGGALTLTGPLTNSGAVRLTDASLTTGGPFTQTAGVTVLRRSALAAGGPVMLAGGALEGTGSVRPSLRNAAVLAPGAPVGTLQVFGDYTQSAAGVLRADIAAAGHDRLEVSGSAGLDGTLEVSSPGFAPADAARFELVVASTLAGRWVNVGADATFSPDYGPATATLVVSRPPVPLPVPTPVPTAAPTVGPAERPNPLPPPNAPVAGEQATARVTGGEVLVKLPGDSGGFVPLKGAASLPDGTVVDARGGAVTFTAAGSYAPGSKSTTTVTVQAAIFQIRQSRARDGRTAVTDVLLRTPPGAARACVRAPRKGLVVRRMRATAKGLVRAVGAATVLTTRNATWRMEDSCQATRTRVSKGRARAFNRLTGRTARLRDRQVHIARAQLFTARKLRLRAAPRP